MAAQTKQIDLKDLKALDEGPGGFEGYVSAYGILDDVGDIVLPGAYTDTIAQFLKRGFSTADHAWQYGQDGIVAYPTQAKSDDYGLWINCRFHSTQDAQNTRTKAQERMAAGMEVALSIGYDIDGPNGASFIFPKDYATELPQYLTPGARADGIAKAGRFPKIRLLKKLTLYEGAIVSVPALQAAMVSAVKSNKDKKKKGKVGGDEIDMSKLKKKGKVGGDEIDMSKLKKSIKGMFEEELAERTDDLWNLFMVLCCVLDEIDDMEDMADAMGMPIDSTTLVRQALDEFNAHVIAGIAAEELEEETGGMEDEGGEGEGEDYGYMSTDRARRGRVGKTGGRGKKEKAHVRLVDGRHGAFTAQLKALGDEAERLTERAKSRVAMRVKDGRVLSAANRTMLSSSADSLQTITDDLKQLVSDTAPKSMAWAQADMVRAEIQRFMLLNAEIAMQGALTR